MLTHALLAVRADGLVRRVDLRVELARPGGEFQADAIGIVEVDRAHEGRRRDDIERDLTLRVIMVHDLRRLDAAGEQLVVILVDQVGRHVEGNMVHRAVA